MQDTARSLQQPRRKTVAEKMAILEKRYPKEEFIWLTPKLDMASELPEHLDLMIQSRKFSKDPDDGDVYILEKAGEKWDPVQRKKVPDEGFVSLAKPAVMALAGDAGINFPKKHRIDDGSNPQILEMEVTGGLVSLSGPIMMTKGKRIDLDLEEQKLEFKSRNFPPKGTYINGTFHKWETLSEEQREKHIRYQIDKQMLQIRTFMNEMAETKAQLRIVRDMLGIPSKFRPSTIKKKGFAVLRVIFAPHAQTREERLMILENTQKMFSGAFLMEPAPQDNGPRKEPPAELIDRPEVQMLPEYSPPAEDAPGELGPDFQGAEVVNAEAEDLEFTRPEEEEKKETTNNFSFLSTIQDLKTELINTIGEIKALEDYYKMLGKFDVKHSNEIIEYEQQTEFYRKLVAMLKQRKKQAEEGGGK